MTLAQKKARENFKKAIAYRKKTGCSLKQAFAHVKGKKVGATKIIERGENKNAKVTKVLQRVRSKKGTFKGMKKVSGVKTPLQYKGYTINYLYGEYRADAYGNPQFSNKNLSKLKKEINEYLKPKKSIKKVSGGTHKDTKSHNVNIRVVSGVSKGKEKMLIIWKDIYGKLASEYVSTKDIKQKKKIYKELKQAKEIIQKLK